MKSRFFCDGIFVRDSRGELCSLMFMDKAKQEEWVDWLNNTINLVEECNEK